jgi:hypothetical protein
MSAYEAFGRVVSGEAHSPAAILALPEGAANSPETLSNLRRLCRDLRPVLQAVGDVSDHALSGIGPVEWSPRWQSEIGDALDRHVLALEALRETAESFAGTVKLEPLVKTYAGTRALLAIGTHLMRQEASHAFPLLGPHAGPLKAALADREAFLREMRRREGRLRGRYRASIYEMNLEDLLASWVDAQSANFLSRNGKLRRVRVQVALHTEGEVPDDLGPEITALTEIAKLQRAGCSADAALVAFGKPWTDPEETSAHLDRALEWTRHALQLEELIGPMLLGAEGVGGRFAALIAPAGPLANGSFGREVFGRFAAAWRTPRSLAHHLP